MIGECEELRRNWKVRKLSRGSFTWIDSDLVESIISGHWIVLDNASLASGALLGMVDIFEKQTSFLQLIFNRFKDRLNSLLEPDGTLD